MSPTRQAAQTQSEINDRFSSLDASAISEVIYMALSDHVSFEQIRSVHGLSADQVKELMRKQLAPGSYRAWRRRVRRFADQRAVYK